MMVLPYDFVKLWCFDLQSCQIGSIAFMVGGWEQFSCCRVLWQMSGCILYITVLRSVL